MSREAWGDSDEDFYGPNWTEQAADAGWLDPDDHEKAAMDVLAERDRQVNVEGWSTDHDDAHADDALALAAVCYALPPAKRTYSYFPWPWDGSWWKPKDRRRDLVRAGALIIAEIARLDRLETAKDGGKP